MKNPKWYPPNWHELARACKEAANWSCEDCGLYIPEQGLEYTDKNGIRRIMYLEASHENHDTLNPNPVLKARCRACHRKYDNSKEQKSKRVSYEVWRHQIMLQVKGYCPASFKQNRSNTCTTLQNKKNSSQKKLRATA